MEPESRNRGRRFLAGVLHNVFVIGGAVVFTTGLFFVLPLIQAIADGPVADTVVREIDSGKLPPPPPTIEEEPEPEVEKEEAPPELIEDVQPLDLAQLELALGPQGMGGGVLSGDFGLKLKTVGTSAKDVDALFSMSDLDQRPRPVYQPGPVMTNKIRRKAPGTVHILFVVDQRGRVQNAKIQKSSNPVFNRAALAAIKKWKFEPGKRKGKAVRFRMRVPITFPEGLQK